MGPTSAVTGAAAQDGNAAGVGGDRTAASAASVRLRSSLARAPRGLRAALPAHRPPSDVAPLLAELATALRGVPAVCAKRQAFAIALGKLSGFEGYPLARNALEPDAKRPRVMPP